MEGYWKQRELINSILETNKTDVLLMQEIKTKFFTEKEASDEGNYFYKFNTEEKHLKSVDERVKKCQKVSKWGCGIGVRKREKKPFTNLETGNHRYSAMVWDERILLVTVYLPTNTGSRKQDELLEETVTDLLLFIKNNSRGLSILISGDFNISDSHSNLRKDQLERMKLALDLEVKYPEGPTNFHYNGGTSLLDYCLHSKDLTIKNVTRIMDLDCNQSTHVPIKFDVTYKKQIIRKTKTEVPPPEKILEARKKIDWSNTDLSLFQQLVKENFTTMKEHMSQCSNGVRYKTACDLIYYSAMASRRKKIRKRKVGNNLQKLLRKDIKVARLSTDKSLKDRLVKRLKNRIRKDQAAKTREKNKKLLRLLRTNDSKTFFSSLKSRDAMVTPEVLVWNGREYQQHEILQCFSEMTETQSEDFRLRSETIDQNFVEKRLIVNLMEERTYSDKETSTIPLDEEVFRKVLRAIQLNKAADIYGLQRESFELLDSDNITEVISLFNEVLDDLHLYSDTFWSVAQAHFLYKGKGKSKTNPKSYRRITIGTVGQKLLERYFCFTTSELIKESQSDLQWGFTPQVSFLQCAVTRETLMTYAHNERRPLLQLATDVENAFSQLCRTTQLYELIIGGYTGKLFTYVVQTYTNTLTFVRSVGCFSGLLMEWRGSKQGAIEAPQHYKCYDSPLIRLLTAAGVGYKIELCVDTGEMVGLQTDIEEMTRLAEHFEAGRAAVRRRGGRACGTQRSRPTRG